MKTLVDYIILFIGILLQTTFLPLNLILAFLIYLFFKKGFVETLPKLIFVAFFLALLSATSLGATLIVFALAVGLVGLLKNLLPAAFFVRAALLILALPTYEFVFTQFSHILTKQ